MVSKDGRVRRHHADSVKRPPDLRDDGGLDPQAIKVERWQRIFAHHGSAPNVLSQFGPSASFLSSFACLNLERALS